jgi:oxygen-independent coproporphyrinogen-3 oxidase
MIAVETLRLGQSLGDEQSREISSSELLRGSPYVAYSYAYPHKTAYRPLLPRRSLRDVWEQEDLRRLFLYLHVPFCEYRCGFCNLFTLAQPEASLTMRYLDSVRRQAEAVRESLGEMQFAHLAIGGGTPTFLSVEELEAAFLILRDTLGCEPKHIPVSVEASPATVTAEKLALLRAFGVDRLSLGVQSFAERDARAMGRPQRPKDVETALRFIRAAGFPIVNIDLIYGGEGQTVDSWLATVAQAIQHGAKEIYLYPLYIRPLTGLGRLSRDWDDQRLNLYRHGRELLLARGYEQVSMRMFRATPTGEIRAEGQAGLCGHVNGAGDGGPVYCCQEDGMIGLGCGARSYTRALHYSREYAVSSGGVQSVLGDYLNCPTTDFQFAHYGFVLDDDEQRRRWAILSLLQVEGLDREQYERRFSRDALDEFPQLADLVAQGLAALTPQNVQLTPRGLERSDTIGPWLYSRRVRQLMHDYCWR